MSGAGMVKGWPPEKAHCPLGGPSHFIHGRVGVGSWCLGNARMTFGESSFKTSGAGLSKGKDGWKRTSGASRTKSEPLSPQDCPHPRFLQSIPSSPPSLSSLSNSTSIFINFIFNVPSSSMDLCCQRRKHPYKHLTPSPRSSWNIPIMKDGRICHDF